MKIRRFTKTQSAFSLAELLIALAILGVIAAFAIPKVLNSQQDGRNKTIVKEAVSMISGAYSAYQMDSTPTSSTKAADLTSYLNYVKYDTLGATTMDSHQQAGTLTCANVEPCIHMHNGGLLKFRQWSFNGRTSTHTVSFFIDPDGKVTDGTTNGPGKSLMLYLHFDGRLSTRGTVSPSLAVDSSGSSYGANPALDPPWFSWD